MALRRAPEPLTVSPMVAALRQGLKLKGNSFLMTLFGDAIGPHHQAVGLGTLIKLASQLGLSSRLVRTSVYRLVEEDWLVASREGRRSYYCLSDSGVRRVQHACSRIHGNQVLTPEMGHWTLLMVSDTLKASTRQQLQRELRWNGYGQVAERVYARTGADKACLHDILQANDAGGHVCVMQAHDDNAFAARPLHALRDDSYCERRMERAWQRFVQRFSPVLIAAKPLSNYEAFLVRSQLVHEFRRLLQRQPVLPHALEPNASLAAPARELFTVLYCQLHTPSESWLEHELAADHGAQTAIA